MNGYFNYRDELYHHGVIGMKWGVRRYQSYAENPKLSNRKKKKLSKKYKKYYSKASKRMLVKNPYIYRHAWNTTADYMNNEFSKKRDTEYKNLSDSEWDEKFQQEAKKVFDIEYGGNLMANLANDKDFMKAQKLAEKYKMESFDDLVKENQDVIRRTAKLLGYDY